MLKVGSRVTYWCITVQARPGHVDGPSRAVLHDVHQLGLANVRAVRMFRMFILAGNLAEESVRQLAAELLIDPVTEQFTVTQGLAARSWSAPSIEVHYQPGVMNPPAISILEAVRRWLRARGFNESALAEVQTGRAYEIEGARDARELEQIASRLLGNGCIERWYIRGLGRNDPMPDRFASPPQREFVVRRVAIRELGDEALAALSREGHLFLALDELRAIRDHYRRIERDPTDLELETLAQTWSEHCVHKTLKSAVHYTGDGFGFDRAGPVDVRYENLLKDTIVAATRKLNRDWCLSVFVDNAGVVEFDDEYGIAFKVETHNHPSAIEPYGGASTGVGGCIRDIMGCGLGAKPIASTDVFCLAHPDFDAARLPEGVLHPRRTLRGVVCGVRDYGNRMGVPTVNGAIYFDDRYLANPLVFCGCVGLIPRNRLAKGARPGDLIVAAGGRTGRDGIHGATFSSSELTDTHADEFAHAVQIGNAIEQKKLLDAMLLARDHVGGCLYSAVTDCGAGGLSSAVGEMAAELGAVVDLEHVPLKYAGLRYDEIWISEAQERMVFAVPPEHWPAFHQVFADEEVEATAIGRFTNDRVLRVRFNQMFVGELDMAFLHDGRPPMSRTARWSRRELHVPPRGVGCPTASAVGHSNSGEAANAYRCPDDDRSSRSTSDSAAAVQANSCTPPLKRWGTHVRTDSTCAALSDVRTRVRAVDLEPTCAALSNQALLALLSDLNVASKEWVIRQYDHEVQGRSVIKPLVGLNSGPSDAAVLRPRYDSYRGIALACGLCPHVSDIDPYWMAVLAVDEALRNVICVGADPERVSILDNFCWPKVDSEESLGALVRTCQGAHDAAAAYGLPFISGKDSLNNQFSMSAEESSRTGLPRQLAIPPTLLVSALGMVNDVRRCVSMDLKAPGNCLVLASAPVDKVGFEAAIAMHRRVASMIATGQVRSVHDVSDGGLAVAIAEMCIASGLGAIVQASRSAPIPTTYVLEVEPVVAEACQLPIIGEVTSQPRFIASSGGQPAIDLSIEDLASAWKSPLARGGEPVDV